MSKRFPCANYRDVVKVAKKLGFYFCRQAKGSHEIWRRDSDNRYTTLVNHGSKAIKRKTLKAIFEDLQISADEFMKLRKGK
jgi:predicted RNA binding protein YcfA (HicA-like mRNA interferase family)